MARIKFNDISESEKEAVFRQTGELKNLPAFAVEKDWWVVQTLSLIFKTSIKDYLVFKGGTSLSKAWKLIDRFSEDIDLAADRAFFGFDGNLTRSKITKLRKASNEYISKSLFPEIKLKFEEKGFKDVTFEIEDAKESDQDPRIIEIYYPNVIESPGYLLPKVQVEIGCRSLREPFSLKSFSSLVDEIYPDAKFAQLSIEVPVVNPERTFLEKLFLLHEEFQRPKEKIRVNRLSRHLYDIYQISKTEFAERAINDRALYNTIVNHRYKYARVCGVNYQLYRPRNINPLPIYEVNKEWEKDYKTLQENMIYGESPSYEELLSHIKEFIAKINELDWEISGDF